MISVYGSEILNVFTEGEQVIEVYNYGVKVWPDWYIYWTPSTLSQQFSINGVTYDMSDFNGYFTNFTGTITDSAFMNTGIVTLDTNAESINYRAFAFCYSLTSVSASQCTYIGNNAFWSCNNITSMYIPECTYVGDYGLGRLNVVQTINIPKCSYIGQYGFFNDYSLQSMDLPECTTINRAAFGYCSALKSVSLPKCDTIGSNVFYNCTSLNTVYLTECNSIDSRAFNFCTSLQSITLGVYDFCTLYNSNVFDNTNTTFKVYVPRTMYNSYVTDTNWSYWSSHIVSYRHASWSPRTILNGFSIISDNVFHSGIVNGKSITEFYTNVSTIGSYALSGCKQLQTATLPACTKISSSAFRGCNSLEEVYAPKCRYLNIGVFSGCSKLSSVVMSYCSYIQDNAFYGCGSLSLELYDCSVIGRAFPNCSRVTLYLYYDGVCDGESGMFDGISISSLSIYVPPDLYSQYRQKWGQYLTLMNPLKSFGYTYTYISSSTTRTYPTSRVFEGGVPIDNNTLLAFSTNTRVIWSDICYGCSSLSVVSLYLCYLIYSKNKYGTSIHTFENCPSLKKVYIYTPEVCELQNSNAFSNATSIYVPWFLVSDYKTAQYWSRYSNRIFAIPS